MHALSPKHFAVQVKPFLQSGSSARQALACNEHLSTRQVWSTNDESKPFPPYLAESSFSASAGSLRPSIIDADIAAVTATVDTNLLAFWIEKSLELSSQFCVCFESWRSRLCLCEGILEGQNASEWYDAVDIINSVAAFKAFRVDRRLVPVLLLGLSMMLKLTINWICKKLIYVLNH